MPTRGRKACGTGRVGFPVLICCERYLVGAGLAEIDWPGADLHDADLHHASFHLGSSRNGLVGSPIACEGSRTGFYTDDYDDQDFKSAEEIRKANLRALTCVGPISKASTFTWSTSATRDTRETRPNTSVIAGRFSKTGAGRVRHSGKRRS